MRRYGVFSGELVLFFDLIDNAIFWEPQGTVYKAQNERKVSLWGFDLRGRGSIGKIQFEGDLTVMKNRVDKVNVLPYRPDVWGRMGVKWGILELDILGMGPRPTYYSQRSSKLDTFSILDLILKKGLRLGESTETVVELRINNILDTHYEIISGYPMPGRNLSLSITFIGK